jgi:hypothetical protein
LHLPARFTFFSLGAEQKEWLKQKLVLESHGKHEKHPGMPRKNQA